MNWNKKLINAYLLFKILLLYFIYHLVTLSPKWASFLFWWSWGQNIELTKKRKKIMNSNRVCGTKSFWEKYMHFLVFIELTVGCFFLYKKADKGLGSSTTVGPVIYVFACSVNFLNTYGIFRDERMTMQKLMAGITYRITTFLGKKLC